MKKINFNTMIEELNKAPNLYSLYKESLNTMSKDDLYKFSEKLEEAFSKYIYKYIENNNLNSELVINYLNDGIDKGLSYNSLSTLKQLNDTINILLNDVQSSIDNKIDIKPKQNDFFSSLSKEE